MDVIALRGAEPSIMRMEHVSDSDQYYHLRNCPKMAVRASSLLFPPLRSVCMLLLQRLLRVTPQLLLPMFPPGSLLC